MLSRAENELLCRVGPDTAMGRMLRRYWIPAATSDELVAGNVKRVRRLGEDFVVVRATDGKAGVRDRDMPLRESGGLVWAYLGPAGTEPPLMAFDWVLAPPSHRVILKARIECNWAQAVEGVIDSAHANYLHRALINFTGDGAETELKADGVYRRPSQDGAPRIEVQNTAYGFRYAAIRRPRAGAEQLKYVRVTLFVAPFFAFIPPPAELQSAMQIFVPIDDEHTHFYFAKLTKTPLDAAQREMHVYRAGFRPGIELDEDDHKVRRRENNWLQDRAAMAAGTSSTGIHGVTMEDAVVVESMGPLYDRTKEHLGASDIAVIRFRRLMLDAARRFGEGAPALGLAEAVPYARLRAEERIVPHASPWQLVGAHAGESVEATSA